MFCRMTEALPVAITSLLPLILFPFFQILNADETAEEYFNDTTYVFIGSTLVAFAMEKVTAVHMSVNDISEYFKYLSFRGERRI